jgi:hypothetical protein
LSLDLLTSTNRRRGSMAVYRGYTEKPLQLDVNLLTSEFPSALANALDRSVIRAVETASPAERDRGVLEAQAG